MTASDAALPSGQKLFLQRLLAQHVMKDEEAQALHEELDESGRPMEQCFREMNHRLTSDFALEIATVSIASGGTHQRFHAIINQRADSIAKASFKHEFNPHQLAYIRLILEKLVSGAASRVDLINLKQNLTEPHTGKVGMEQAEECIDRLLDQQWLVLEGDENQSRRASMNALINIAPRTYLELSRLLIDFGMPKEDLPQFIFHRM
mmetsp:Transcript_377/g.520  ORF Transcript_377/g.520 Transcript_377/m.520 type:complete len:206 (-) Transcript_377:1232-1849(-)